MELLVRHEPRPQSPCRSDGTDGSMGYLKVQTSWEATLDATGFLLLLRGKSGSAECGLLPCALFVEGDMG